MPPIGRRVNYFFQGFPVRGARGLGREAEGLKKFPGGGTLVGMSGRDAALPPDSGNQNAGAPPEPENAGEQNVGEHWRYCPVCSHELINQKCKLRCPRCHYFMSCSDFDR
jgi:hypothetical protein